MTDKKHLYCCSSYYQVLISLIKAMAEEQKIDLVLEEHGIATAAQLAGKLESRMKDIVGRAYVCPDSEKVDPYIQRLASFIPWQRRQVAAHMSGVFGDTERKIQNIYDQIHVFWDLGYTGTYLNIRNIHYTLHEDSLNSYQHIRENRKNYAYIFRRRGLKFLLKKYFHMGVIPFGYSDCCDVVEVNEREGIEIPQDKVREVSRAELEKKLSQSQKKAVFDAFTDGMVLEASSGEGPVLILTEPFAVTGRLRDEETQIRLYREVLEKYAAGRNILLKPHPRDDTDYQRYFPDAKVMEKNIPTEILNFDETFRFSRAVTVTSSALQGIHCADEKVYLGPEFLGKFR